MITNNVADKIKAYISVNDFLTDRRMPTNKELDDYLLKHYADNVNIEFIKDDFITYEVVPDHVFIKDIVCFGNAWQLLNLVIDKAKELNLPVRAFVHFSNFEILNVIIRRFNFKIIDKTNSQYLLERSI